MVASPMLGAAEDKKKKKGKARAARALGRRLGLERRSEGRERG